MQLTMKKSALLLTVLAVSGCGSEESTTTTVATEVPFSVTSLPMPNDGYGYDDDGTISLPDEPGELPLSQSVSYYQDFEKSFAGVDGWGLCTEPLEIPLASIDSDQRYPLQEQALPGSVVLLDGTDLSQVGTKLSSDGTRIIIECNQVLKASEVTNPQKYYLVVTDGAMTHFGEPLRPSADYTTLMATPDDELSVQALLAKESAREAEEMYRRSNADSGHNIVYAATFTTQRSYAVPDRLVELASGATLHFAEKAPVEQIEREARETAARSGIGDLFVEYNKYEGSLAINNYLPLTEETKGGCTLDYYDPVAKCPELYQWMTTTDGGHLSYVKPEPQVISEEDIPVDLYLPKTDNETEAQEQFEKFKDGQIPVVMFIHGITADKSAAALMMKDFVKSGLAFKQFAVIAIDMPYHGERIIQDANGLDISAKEDKAYFINITSPLALRSNLYQAVSDFISLRYAIDNYTGADEVHLVGHSLGGIVSVMVSEMTQSVAPAQNPSLKLSTANFVVPGQGLVNLTMSSLTLGGEMESSVKYSASIQRAVAEALVPEVCVTEASNKTCIDALAGEDPATVAKLTDDIYQAIIPLLKTGVQRTIDSADPASKTHRQTANRQPTLLIEAKGNCGEICEIGEYMPDTVVPNSADNNQLTGTEPLIRALELEDIRDDIFRSGDLRGVIRASVGGHGTYLFPYEGPMDETGLPSVSELGEVYSSTNTQQEAVFEMISSNASSITFSAKDLENIETGEDPQ